MNKLLIGIAFLLIICSCKEDILVSITDEPIYSKFEVTYTAESSRTKGKASFWKGTINGSRASFNAKASLTFNGEVLLYQQSGYYEKELLGFFQTSSFKIIDANKKQFVNTIGTSDISMPTTDTILTSQPWQLIWKSNSAAVDTGETITVRLELQTYTQDSLGVTSITIPASDLATRKGKTYQVSIERLKTQNLGQNLGGGGSISVQYIGKAKSIYFK